MTRPARQLARWAVAGVLAFLLVAAAVLWWRRLVGAFSIPLDPAALLIISTLIAALVALMLAKASLVVLYYMHLRWESRVLRWAVGIPFFSALFYVLIVVWV